MLLVSVLIPVYNHEKYVTECLDSIRDSDYKSVELIIIDDGSKDTSASLVESWLGANEHHFVRTQFVKQANSGVCKTVNRLIGLAQGDIVVPIASDDVLLPSGISLRVKFLQSNPQLLAVFADAAMIDTDGKILCREMERNFYKANKEALADPEFIAAELILRWCIPGPVFAAWRRTFDPVQGVGLYDETMLAEDRDFYLRLLSRKALGYFPEEVALYRHVPTSLSRIKVKNYSIHRSILQSEKDACKIFSGKERLLLRLVSVKSEIFLIDAGHKFIKPLWFISLLLRISVKLAYQVHKLSVAVSHRNAEGKVRSLTCS